MKKGMSKVEERAGDGKEAKKKNRSSRENSSGEREKWGYDCQAFGVLRAVAEIYFRPEDGGIVFLRNACYIYKQTTGLPDGMSVFGSVWSVGVQAVRGAAVGLTISVVSGGLRLKSTCLFGR